MGSDLVMGVSELGLDLIRMLCTNYTNPADAKDVIPIWIGKFLITDQRIWFNQTRMMHIFGAFLLNT